MGVSIPWIDAIPENPTPFSWVPFLSVAGSELRREDLLTPALMSVAAPFTDDVGAFSYIDEYDNPCWQIMERYRDNPLGWQVLGGLPFIRYLNDEFANRFGRLEILVPYQYPTYDHRFIYATTQTLMGEGKIWRLLTDKQDYQFTIKSRQKSLLESSLLGWYEC